MQDIYVVLTKDYEEYGANAPCSLINLYTGTISPCRYQPNLDTCASAEVGEHTVFMEECDNVQLDASELLDLVRIIHSQLLS